jgi:hypothetical protein
MKFSYFNFTDLKSFIENRNLNKINNIVNKPRADKMHLISFAFFFLVFFCFNFSEAKSLNKKFKLNSINNAKIVQNLTFPEKLPKYSMLNFTDYNLFENLMLNLKINRIEAKEVNIKLT